jgi:hypothetical protein
VTASDQKLYRSTRIRTTRDSLALRAATQDVKRPSGESSATPGERVRKYPFDQGQDPWVVESGVFTIGAITAMCRNNHRAHVE